MYSQNEIMSQKFQVMVNKTESKIQLDIKRVELEMKA